MHDSHCYKEEEHEESKVEKYKVTDCQSFWNNRQDKFKNKSDTETV